MVIGVSLLKVHVIGAGLAGVEAAYYLLKKGHHVILHEMRPKVMTPAHRTGHFAELVCSNSLRSNDILNAVGLLKAEMRLLDSIILQAAEVAQVPAGSALAVDREMFSTFIENKLKSFENLEISYEPYNELEIDAFTIVATGPLTTQSLMESIGKHTDFSSLHFFDAVAPIIEYDSINMDICYKKSRYDKGDADYINCPMDKETYLKFYEYLMASDKVEIKDFENNVFEGCMPVETMAERGVDTLRFGPLKPVGLELEGKLRPHAVIQLRQDDVASSMYNIVGFQTHLTFPAQKALIQMVPGLERANIMRYGVMHKNNYLESPKMLRPTGQLLHHDKIFIAGQLSGVEGYVESAASGMHAAIHMDRLIRGLPLKPISKDSMMGAMAHYISTPNRSFVPMNANFGLLDAVDEHLKKDQRKKMYSDRAIKAFESYVAWLV
jgi:methylenetetrahydrofolate--tRNA-(uracil-5-)-methyltransferase